MSLSSLWKLGGTSSFFLASTCLTSLEGRTQKPGVFRELLDDPSPFLLSLDLDLDLGLLLGFAFGSPFCLEVEADRCDVGLSFLLSRDLDLERDGVRPLRSLDLDLERSSDGERLPSFAARLFPDSPSLPSAPSLHLC